MASLVILFPPLIVLVCTALAVVTEAGKAGPPNPGAHGFSEILYAFSSMGNNNGSAFAGIGANTPFYNLVGGIAMLVARYWIAIPTLAIAGSLGRKKLVPTGLGTLPTHSQRTSAQFTEPFRACTKPPNGFITALAARSLETAASGGTPKASTRIGVISAPPPMPVSPTIVPTPKPAKASRMSTDRFCATPAALST